METMFLSFVIGKEMRLKFCDTTGMVVSLKTDLRFPIPGQQGHGARIIQYRDRKAVKIYVEFYSFLYIIKVTETI